MMRLAVVVLSFAVFVRSVWAQQNEFCRMSLSSASGVELVVNFELDYFTHYTNKRSSYWTALYPNYYLRGALVEDIRALRARLHIIAAEGSTVVNTTDIPLTFYNNFEGVLSARSSERKVFIKTTPQNVNFYYFLQAEVDGEKIQFGPFSLKNACPDINWNL